MEFDCLLLLVLRLTVLSLTCCCLLLLVLLVDKAELWSTAELTTLSSRTRDVVALSTRFVVDDDTTGSARSAMRCDVIVVVAVDVDDDVASSVANVTPTAAVPVDFGTL